MKKPNKPALAMVCVMRLNSQIIKKKKIPFCKNLLDTYLKPKAHKEK
jgi:hypothetical protein